VSAIPSGGDDPAISVNVEKAAAIRCVKHTFKEVTSSPESPIHTYAKSYQATWEPDASGNWVRENYQGEYTIHHVAYYGAWTNDLRYTWSATNAEGSKYSDGVYQGSIVDLGSGERDQVLSVPHYDWGDVIDISHFYANGVKHEWTLPDGLGQSFTEAVTVKARTKLMLYTGGKAKVAKKSLIHLTGGAREWQQAASPFWMGTPSTIVEPTKIKVLGWWLFGRHLDSDGELYRVLPDNAAMNLNLRVPGVKDYSAWASVEKHKLVHLTKNQALTDPNLERTKLGVGEEVTCGFYPPVTLSAPDILWTVTGGGIDYPTQGAMTFTAPSNAANVTLTVKVKDAEKLTEKFTVVEPSGFDHTLLTHTFPNKWPPGWVAVEMQNRTWVAPTDVSFYRVMISEFGKDANTVTGYFADTNKFTTNPEYYFHHWPGGVLGDNYAWGLIDQNNEIGGAQQNPGDWAGLIPTLTVQYTPPWSTGTIYVDIPVKWRVGAGGPTNNLANGWDQRVTIDASGTVVVEKFGQQTTRTVNNVVTPNIP
jgi:hypothetical protein